jgi:hypothetical protein
VPVPAGDGPLSALACSEHDQGIAGDALEKKVVRTDRTSAVRRQIRAHPIASSQLSVLQPLRKCEIL